MLMGSVDHFLLEILLELLILLMEMLAADHQLSQIVVQELLLLP